MNLHKPKGPNGYPMNVVFNHTKKVAFFSEGWSVDIDALGTNLGWCWDNGNISDKGYFTEKGYEWFNNRLDALSKYATRPELIWDGTDEDDED